MSQLALPLQLADHAVFASFLNRGNEATQTQTAAGKTEEITSKAYLSRDNTRPNPNDPFASNNARGTQLDIKV